MAIQDKFNRANVIYKITKDIDLKGETLTIPEGCTLDFQGGSFSNGLLNVDTNNIIGGNGILKNIKFVGKIDNQFTIKLDWFIKKYPKNVLDTTVDNTEEIRDAINSGCNNIVFPYKYIHITETILINRCVNFLFDGSKNPHDTNFSSNELSDISQFPCVFSKNVITLFDFKINTKSQDVNLATPLYIGAISLYVDVKYTDTQNKLSPIINVETEDINDTLWGITFDCSIKSKRYSCTINEETDTFLNYTGIKIESKNGAISYVKINGYIYGTCYGVYFKGYKHSTPNWFTDVIINGNTWCCYGGFFDNVSPVIVYGSHQTHTLDHNDNRKEAYFTGGIIKVYGYIWDCERKSTRSSFRTVTNTIKVTDPVLSIDCDVKSNIYKYNRYPQAFVETIDIVKSMPQINNVLYQALYYNIADTPITSFSYKVNQIDVFEKDSNVYNVDYLFNDNMLTSNIRPLKDSFAYINGTGEVQIDITFSKINICQAIEGGNPFVLFHKLNNSNNTYKIEISDGTNILYSEENTGSYYSYKLNKIVINPFDIVGDTIIVSYTANINTGGILPTLIVPANGYLNDKPVISEKFSYPKFASNKRHGVSFFDKTKNIPIWWNGAKYINAFGDDIDKNIFPLRYYKGPYIETTETILKIKYKERFTALLKLGLYSNPSTVLINITADNKNKPTGLKIFGFVLNQHSLLKSAIAYYNPTTNEYVIEIVCNSNRYFTPKCAVLDGELIDMSFIENSEYDESVMTNKVNGDFATTTRLVNVLPSNAEEGSFVFDANTNKPWWYYSGKWMDAEGNYSNFKQSGNFENKPVSPKVGFAYFCTDRQTAEGASNGIMIYHKGNDVWVDALGRIVE